MTNVQISFSEEELHLIRGAMLNFRNSAVERLMISDEAQKLIYKSFIEKSDQIMQKLEKTLGEENTTTDGSEKPEELS